MRYIILLLSLLGCGNETYYGITHPEVYQGLGGFNYYSCLLCCWFCVYAMAIGMWDVIRSKTIKTAEDRFKEAMNARTNEK
jgi:hypothetical protein